MRKTSRVTSANVRGIHSLIASLRLFVDALMALPSVPRRARHLFRCIAILALLPTTTLGAEVRLGVVMDVPKTETSLCLLETLEDEIQKTLGASHELRFDDADIQSTNWDYTKSLVQYRTLASHCDVILLLGSGAIHEVASNGTFSIPTLGLGVFEPRIQGIPYEEIVGEIGFDGNSHFSGSFGFYASVAVIFSNAKLIPLSQPELARALYGR